VRGNTVLAARQPCRSLKAPYELLTVQLNLPPTLHCTGLLSGGGVVDEPAASAAHGRSNRRALIDR
jgi:hypothetical protein